MTTSVAEGKKRKTISVSSHFERAQASINLPEVQVLLRELAAYNLAVCMPHMHTESDSFAPLPSDFLQVEKAGQVSFEPRSSTEHSRAVPVSWRWVGNGASGRIEVTAVCVQMMDGSHRPLPGIPQPVPKKKLT